MPTGTNVLLDSKDIVERFAVSSHPGASIGNPLPPILIDGPTAPVALLFCRKVKKCHSTPGLRRGNFEKRKMSYIFDPDRSISEGQASEQ